MMNEHNAKVVGFAYHRFSIGIPQLFKLMVTNFLYRCSSV